MKQINRLGVIYVAVLLVTVAQGIGILTVANHAHSSSHAVTAMARLDSQANRLNALKWQATAKGAVGPDLRAQMRTVREEASALLADLMPPTPDSPDADHVREAYGHYIRAVDEM